MSILNGLLGIFTMVRHNEINKAIAEKGEDESIISATATGCLTAVGKILLTVFIIAVILIVLFVIWFLNSAI